MSSYVGMETLECIPEKGEKERERLVPVLAEEKYCCAISALHICRSCNAPRQCSRTHYLTYLPTGFPIITQAMITKYNGEGKKKHAWLLERTVWYGTYVRARKPSECPARTVVLRTYLV